MDVIKLITYLETNCYHFDSGICINRLYLKSRLNTIFSRYINLQTTNISGKQMILQDLLEILKHSLQKIQMMINTTHISMYFKGA